MGMNIRIREARGTMSQQALATVLGVSRGAIAQWEREENPTHPRMHHLEKLADVTGVDLVWLQTGIDTARMDQSTPQQSSDSSEVTQANDAKLLTAYASLFLAEQGIKLQHPEFVDLVLMLASKLENSISSTSVFAELEKHYTNPPG